jgi:hypothetical protein
VPPGTTKGDNLVIVAALRTGATESLTSITDSAGNTWVRKASAYPGSYKPQRVLGGDGCCRFT